MYDLWSDPYLQHPVNAERPELVEKYKKFLEKQWEGHQLLAKRFHGGGEVTMTPEQLETLKALGYIR